MPSDSSSFVRSIRTLFRRRGNTERSHVGAQVEGELDNPNKAAPAQLVQHNPPIAFPSAGVSPVKPLFEDDPWYYTERRAHPGPQHSGRFLNSGVCAGLGDAYFPPPAALHPQAPPFLDPSTVFCNQDSDHGLALRGAAHSGLLATNQPGEIAGNSPYHPSHDRDFVESPPHKPICPPTLPQRRHPRRKGYGIQSLPHASVPIDQSHFSHAHDFVIHNLTNHFAASSKTVYEYLEPHVSWGAAHDSGERCDAPACHEETRVAIRQDIMSWIYHGEGNDDPKSVMWLSGPAGAGKTAIATSIAQSCKEEGILAATFMFSSFSSFSGSADRRLKRGVVATLAYDLCQHEALELYEANLLRSLERRPDIFHKNLKEQAEWLILGPLGLIHHQDRVGWPLAIVIDGLDEVVAEQHYDPTGQKPSRTSEEDQNEILEVLLTLSLSPYFPFRIFVSSRPERNITNFFDNTAAEASTLKLFLDSKYDPDSDIERFLQSKFSQIRRDCGILDPLWPGQSILDRVIRMSSGQFIVPTTVIRWVNAGVPQQQLDDVLRLEEETDGSRNPFATLDALYRHILKRARNPEDDPRLVVKWILTFTPGMLPYMAPAQFWRRLLEDYEGELNYRMAPVSSLVQMAPPDDTSSSIVIHHKSLADFLSVEARCGDLYVNDTVYNAFVARRIVGVLKDKGPRVSRSLTIDDLQLFFSHFISLELVLGDFPGGFLDNLAQDACAAKALASCDVAWWMSMGLIWGHSYLASRRLFLAIFLRIHRAMKCKEAAEFTIGQVEGGFSCHEACVNWRTGILAGAKALNACVHRLEEVAEGQLENEPLEVVFEKLAGMEKYRGGSFVSCSVCQLMSSRP